MDQYVVYCFLGMAEDEDNKVFLWPHWERCFFLFDPILNSFAKTSFIKSNQAYEIPLKAHKGDPPGIRRVTFKSVPLGRLRWTYEDNKKWSQRAMEKGEYPMLWVLRESLGLTGTKFGCGMAQCGACTVHLDGEAVRS